jgi:peptidyl-prolyl cis-trans isomerase C
VIAIPSTLEDVRTVTASERSSRRFLALFEQTLREPLVHFLVIGLALFGLYGWMNRGRTSNGNYQIVLTLDDLKQLDVSFVSQWHRQPTPVEFRGLVESFIRQEVLYREGLAMGLDKDDTIVKRRMAQKMEFLSEDVARAHEPTTRELKEWYGKNSPKFALPDRATFRHLFFGFDRRGQNAHVDAVSALAKLIGAPEDSTLARTLADPFMFQDYYGDRGPDQLAKEFGPTFAMSLYKLKPGMWQGPIESGYGWHLIWIESITPGRVPAFEEVEPDVKTAWLADQKAIEWQKAYEKMRANYEVVAPQPAVEPAEVKTAPFGQNSNGPQTTTPQLAP